MSSEYNEQQKFYDAGYQDVQLGDKGFPDLKIVGNVLVTGKKILSIGGGNGADVLFLTTNNSVFLLDGSPVAVEQAKARGIDARVADVEKVLPFTDYFFDVVIVKDILEHIYNPISLLLEAKRIVKKDGYIILSLPNHFYFPFRLRIFFGGNMIWKSFMHNHKKNFEEWNYMHIRFFTWRGVKKMLKYTDLEIKKAYWDFGTLAHYSDPEMYHQAFIMNNKKIENRRQWFVYKFLFPLYKVFNLILPPRIRSLITGLAPGLLCAGFYLKIVKK